MPNAAADNAMHTAERLLRETFGHDELRPIQHDIITRTLGETAKPKPGDRGGALVVMPTGSGKSLTYQLPALVLAEQSRDAESNGDHGDRPAAVGVTLVFSPLIALMEDQVAALKKKGVRAVYINSTLRRDERDRRYQQIARGEFDIVYATPERMSKPPFREALDQLPHGVRLLAVDEAHCISKWGHDLRPAYREIGRFRKELGSPATIALTATATRPVRDDIRDVLGLDAQHMPLFATGIDRPNLSISIEDAWDDAAKDDAIERISTDMGGVGIVYYALIKDLDRAAQRLRKRLNDRDVAIYHGKLHARQKKRVYDRFINAAPDDKLILLATNAFGMGVDKPDIRFIVHAQLPGSVEAYYQEIGRAGRDGKPSDCTLLYCEDDLAIQQQFVEWQNPSAELVERAADVIEHSFGDGRDIDFDADMVSDKVTGRRGDGRIGYVLTELEHLGVIEIAALAGLRSDDEAGDATFYRFVRPLEPGEVDPDEVEAKRKRDLTRLLEVVRLKDADDVSTRIVEYFELG